MCNASYFIMSRNVTSRPVEQQTMVWPYTQQPSKQYIASDKHANERVTTTGVYYKHHASDSNLIVHSDENCLDQQHPRHQQSKLDPSCDRSAYPDRGPRPIVNAKNRTARTICPFTQKDCSSAAGVKQAFSEPSSKSHTIFDSAAHPTHTTHPRQWMTPTQPFYTKPATDHKTLITHAGRISLRKTNGQINTEAVCVSAVRDTHVYVKEMTTNYIEVIFTSTD